MSLYSGGVDAQTKAGKLPVPEHRVLVIDRETVDDTFGERAILACGHILVLARPNGYLDRKIVADATLLTVSVTKAGELKPGRIGAH